MLCRYNTKKKKKNWKKIITSSTFSAVIQLGVSGIVSGIDIDVTEYSQCAPTTVSIIGHLRDSPGKVKKKGGGG